MREATHVFLLTLFAGLTCFCGTIFLGLLIKQVVMPVVGPFFHGVLLWMGQHELQVSGCAFLVSAVVCILLFFLGGEGKKEKKRTQKQNLPILPFQRGTDAR